jgi:hypothetical protein
MTVRYGTMRCALTVPRRWRWLYRFLDLCCSPRLCGHRCETCFRDN